MPVTLTDKNILILTDVINGGGPPLSLSRGECAAIVALAETAPRCTVRIHPEEGLTISTPDGERDQHRVELARRDDTLAGQTSVISHLRQDLAQARSALEQATAGWQERENELVHERGVYKKQGEDLAEAKPLCMKELRERDETITRLRDDVNRALCRIDEANSISARTAEALVSVTAQLDAAKAQAAKAEQGQNVMSGVLVLLLDAKFGQDGRTMLYNRVVDKINSFK